MSYAAAAQAKFVNDINRINSRLDHQFQLRLKEMKQDFKQLSRSYDLRKFEMEVFLKKVMRKNSDYTKLSIKFLGKSPRKFTDNFGQQIMLPPPTVKLREYGVVNQNVASSHAAAAGAILPPPFAAASVAHTSTDQQQPGLNANGAGGGRERNATQLVADMIDEEQRQIMELQRNLGQMRLERSLTMNVVNMRPSGVLSSQPPLSDGQPAKLLPRLNTTLAAGRSNSSYAHAHTQAQTQLHAQPETTNSILSAGLAKVSQANHQQQRQQGESIFPDINPSVEQQQPRHSHSLRESSMASRHPHEQHQRVEAETTPPEPASINVSEAPDGQAPPFPLTTLARQLPKRKKLMFVPFCTRLNRLYSELDSMKRDNDLQLLDSRDTQDYRDSMRINKQDVEDLLRIQNEEMDRLAPAQTTSNQSH